MCFALHNTQEVLSGSCKRAGTFKKITGRRFHEPSIYKQATFTDCEHGNTTGHRLSIYLAYEEILPIIYFATSYQNKQFSFIASPQTFITYKNTPLVTTGSS